MEAGSIRERGVETVSDNVVPEGLFGKRKTVEQVEEGHELAPKFDPSGFIPCVTTDFQSGEVLMVAVMNREALAKTIETGEAFYYSRSRKQLWHKGATSGLIQRVVAVSYTHLTLPTLYSV